MAPQRPSEQRYIWWKGRKLKYQRTIKVGAREYYVLNDYQSTIKAFDASAERMCVIKFRTPPSPRGTGSNVNLRLSRFAELRHAGLPTVYDKGQQGEKEYIVLSWTEGKDLSFYLKKGEKGKPYFDVDRGHFLCCRLARALEKIHALGVCHGDIKPANLVVTDQIRLSLIDFGAAWSSAVMLSRPRPGEKLLSAPEADSYDAAIDSRADQFAASAVFYWILTGVLPYDHIAGSGYRDSTTMALTPPKSLNPSINDKLSAVLSKGLQAAPNDRYPTTEHWLRDLILAAPKEHPLTYGPNSIAEAWEHLKGTFNNWLSKNDKDD